MNVKSRAIAFLPFVIIDKQNKDIITSHRSWLCHEYLLVYVNCLKRDLDLEFSGQEMRKYVSANKLYILQL